MNSALVTTGPQAFTVNSVDAFQLSAWNNGVPWALASATLLLTDPQGNGYSVPASVSGFKVTAPWQVIGPVGTWVRSWDCTGTDGVRQVSLPITFEVVQSPGTPF